MKQLLALLLFVPSLCLAQLSDYVPTDGLVSWWTFDGNALDASGNDNDGLVDGNPALLPSFVYDSFWDRDVVHFDDIDDELTILAPDQLGFSNEFSFSCWLFPSEQNQGQVMSMDNGRFSFAVDGPIAHFDALSTTSWASEAYYCGWNNYSYTPPDGWFHMAITISSDSIKAYGNGELITTLDCGGQSNFDTNLIFGFRNMNSSYDNHWGGSLANCGVWNRALTSVEVEALYSGINPASSSGPNTAAGVFDGDDHIWLTATDFLNFGQSSFTAHVQFRPTDLIGLSECCSYQTLIAKGGGQGVGQKGFILDLRGEPDNARIQFNLTTGPGTNIVLVAPIEENEWYDLVCVVDWEIEWAALYLNGTLVQEGSLASLGSMNNAWYPTIGRYVWDNDDENNAHFFRGEFSRLRVLEGADYELGLSPCSNRENTLFEVNEFTAEEVASQVSSTFVIDEVLNIDIPCDTNSSTYGCMEELACNFNFEANVSDESCEYGCLYCGEGTVWDSALALCISTADTIYIEPVACSPSCGEGTVWDPVNEECIIAIPADLNYDGCVTVNDLLELLAVHGTCPPYPQWPDEPADTTWTCSDSTLFDNYWYETVLIGDQCWFAENLRTKVYGNGDAIPAGLTDGEWGSTTSGATAVYGEDDGCSHNSPDIDACDAAESLAEYGRLYNWYAVDDARGLCPAGWHVPTDGEWLNLKNYSIAQGFSATYGTALKSLSGWYNGGNGTDDFGFSAPSGGVRYSSGNFSGAGSYGYWWSSSPLVNVADYAYYWDLGFDDPTTNQGACPLQYGFSVRCLRDAE